jgi:hypothetical protein
MKGIKSYGLFLISLLVALIVLRVVVLKFGKKLPLVGGAVQKAEDLAFD